MSKWVQERAFVKQGNTRTLLAIKFLFAGTLLANKFLFAGIHPANNVFLLGNGGHTYQQKRGYLHKRVN